MNTASEKAAKNLTDAIEATYRILPEPIRENPTLAEMVRTYFRQDGRLRAPSRRRLQIDLERLVRILGPLIKHGVDGIPGVVAHLTNRHPDYETLEEAREGLQQWFEDNLAKHPNLRIILAGPIGPGTGKVPTPGEAPMPNPWSERVASKFSEEDLAVMIPQVVAMADLDADGWSRVLAKVALTYTGDRRHEARLLLLRAADSLSAFNGSGPGSGSPS